MGGELRPPAPPRDFFTVFKFWKFLRKKLVQFIAGVPYSLLLVDSQYINTKACGVQWEYSRKNNAYALSYEHTLFDVPHVAIYQLNI